MTDPRVEIGAEAIWDALDRSVCLGDTMLHQAAPIWGDRADPPEDYGRWIEYAAARMFAALESAGYTIAKLEQVGWLGFEGHDDDPEYDDDDFMPLGEGPIVEENWRAVTHRPVYRIVEES